MALPAVLTASSFNEIATQAADARKANNVPRAIELYEQGLTLKPDWKQGLWYLGTLDYDSDRYAAGSKAFRRLVGLDAKAAPAWALLGLCEFETADYAKSLADMERGISLGAAKEKQMGVVVLYHEALALTLTGKFDEALQKYKVFVHAGAAKSQTMLLSIGAAALRAKLLPKNIQPAQQPLYLAAGKTASLVLAGNYPQAGQSFADLLARYPTARNVHYLYGEYMLARDIATAIQQFRRELQIDPDNIQART
ncbi:MAG: tetratricopeptide repeat protein, partial [Terriglobia bacterium]